MKRIILSLAVGLVLVIGGTGQGLTYPKTGLKSSRHNRPGLSEITGRDFLKRAPGPCKSAGRTPLKPRARSPGPQALESIRDREDLPPEAISASVSLDGVIVALRAGEDGRDETCWRETASGKVSFHYREGERLKTLYLARMPESGKHTLKGQLASEVAHIRRARPDIAVVALADGAPDNWTFLESLSPEAQAVDFWHSCELLCAASDHAVDPNWFETYRHTL